MKWLWFFLVLLGCKPVPVTPVVTSEVSMVGNQFQPKSIRVKVGTKVTWTNRSSTLHNVVGDSFKSPYLGAAQNWTHEFDTVGKFEYYCEPHRNMGMTGTVIVEE